jgi:superfamily II DNA or RNA helicase
MAYFKKLITNKILKNNYTIESQRLASCMAWQILNDYPRRNQSNQWAIYNKLRGVMLADEVGGGKTFETIAIISKAFLSNTEKSSKRDRFRVLIIANPSIRSKWEWCEKDDINFDTFIEERYKSKCDLGKFIKQTDLDIPSKRKLFHFFSTQGKMKKKDWLEFNKPRQGIWLTSFQGLPPTKRANINSCFKQDGRKKKVFPNNFFDWVIVDEAHSLKSGNKDIDESIRLDNSAVRKIYAVLNACNDVKVLLLTATPFQNNKSELQHLLSLLEDVDKKNDNESITGLISKGIDAFEKEFKNLITEEISVEKVKTLKKNFNHDINSLLALEGNEKIERPKELHINGAQNGLDDFLRDIMIRNTKEPLKIIPATATLDEKSKLQYLLYRDLIKISEEESQMFSTKLAQMVSSDDSFSKRRINSISYRNINKLFDNNQVFEAKYNKLVETIEKIKVSKGKKVITVFVSWIDTVEQLEELFKKQRKYTTCKLTGNISTDERKEKLNEIDEYNKDTKKKIILLASRVGNEGLDLDSFCNRVIHYDNNFNPAVIDQRNGRVYRNSNIKTRKKKVAADDIKVYQLYIEETYDQRILFIEQEKRKLKNFYLGDGSLQELLEETIKKNNLKKEDKLIKLIDSIKIDLTPHKKYILRKYRNEICLRP